MAGQQYYDLEVTGFAFGGDCIGRLPDWRAVFVPFTMPGEKVRVELVEEKRGYARARLLEVIHSSPDRIKPLCIHFGVCGGCDYQHIPYELQLAAKAGIVRDQLQRIAGIVEPPVQPVVPCPEPYYYRNTVQFHQDEDGRLGYVRHDKRGVLAIQECHLPQAAVNETWPQLQFEPLEGLDRIGVRQGSGEEVLVWLESQSIEAPEMELDIPVSAVHLSPAGSIILAGDDYVVLEVLGRAFKVSAGSFFQVNVAQAEAMVSHLLKYLPLNSATTLADIYSGVGLFSAFLAPKVRKLVAVELSPAAVEDFATNLDEFDHVELYVGKAEDILPGFAMRPDVVIVDPPRAGLERRALDALVALQPAFLAYVSCDLATFARDTKRLLAAGYQLEQVTPFDLFPQTYHVETISFFTRPPA